MTTSVIPVPWRWLESTENLQRTAYDVDRVGLAERTVEVNALQYYLTWNLLAAFVELAEMSVEFGWAPWSTDGTYANVDRMRDEAVDVNHFLGNLLSVVGVTDDAYEGAYRSKQERNRRRAASGIYSKRAKGGLGEGSDVG